MSVRIACFFTVQNEAHRDARDVLLNRHAGVHERERRTADRRHRRRSVRFQHFADQRASCRGTRPAAAGSARARVPRDGRGRSRGGRVRASGASRRPNRREVVVVHVALVRIAMMPSRRCSSPIEPRVAAVKHLRLSAREDAGAVDALQRNHLRPDRADLVGLAAVGADLLVDDHDAELFLLHRLDDLVEVFAAFFFEQLADRRRPSDRSASSASLSESLANAAFALAFSMLRIALATSFSNVLRTHASSAASTTSNGIRRVSSCRLSSRACRSPRRSLDLSCANSTAPRKSSSEIFVSAAFDHHHRVGRAGDDDVHAAGFVLRQGRVDDVLAVFVAADAHRGDVLRERNVAKRRVPHRRRTRRARRRRVRGSIDSTVVTIMTSLRKPSGNSGRIGRSIWRALSVPCSDGRPSRLM